MPGSCFDSIPSDLVTYTAVKTLKSLDPNAQIKAGKSVSAFKIKGEASGGTVSTIMSAFDEVPKSDLKKSSAPYALSPSASLLFLLSCFPLVSFTRTQLTYVTYRIVKGPRIANPPLISSLPVLSSPKIVGGYFMMSLPNTQIVRRSWGIQQSRLSLTSFSSKGNEDSLTPYGEDFDYSEFMQMPNRFSALMLNIVLALGAAFVVALPPVSTSSFCVRIVIFQSVN